MMCGNDCRSNLSPQESHSLIRSGYVLFFFFFENYKTTFRTFQIFSGYDIVRYVMVWCECMYVYIYCMDEMHVCMHVCLCSIECVCVFVYGWMVG